MIYTDIKYTIHIYLIVYFDQEQKNTKTIDEHQNMKSVNTLRFYQFSQKGLRSTSNDQADLFC